MAHDHSNHSNDHQHEHLEHHLGFGAYFGVLLALLVLTAVSFYVARFDWGAWDVVVALAIATTKATLVALYFMHLINARFASRMVVIFSAVLVLIMISILFTDVGFREHIPTLPGWTGPPR